MEVLKSDAGFVLEIGSRVLERASESLCFSCKSRPKFSPPTEIPPRHEHEELQDFQEGSKTIPDEGTVVFGLSHQDPDWTTNACGYSFERLQKGPLAVTATKYGDRTIELGIEGLRNHTVFARHRIPRGEYPGVTVAITWKQSEILVYLNGECVGTITEQQEG